MADCSTDGSQSGCQTFEYSNANATADMASLCNAMFWMPGCTILKLCDQHADSHYCQPMSILADVCVKDPGMSRMKGCATYNNLCKSSTVVQQCSVRAPIPHLLSTSNVTSFVRQMCQSHAMAGCEKCPVGGRCDFLQVVLKRSATTKHHDLSFNCFHSLDRYYRCMLICANPCRKCLNAQCGRKCARTTYPPGPNSAPPPSLSFPTRQLWKCFSIPATRITCYSKNGCQQPSSRTFSPFSPLSRFPSYTSTLSHFASFVTRSGGAFLLGWMLDADLAASVVPICQLKLFKMNWLRMILPDSKNRHPLLPVSCRSPRMHLLDSEWTWSWCALLLKWWS